MVSSSCDSRPRFGSTALLTFDLLEQKDNFLLKETMYLTTLACLMKRHGKSNHTFCELPEAYSKILRVKELLVEMPETNFSLQDLADMVGLSAWHFLRQFKNM